MVYSPAEAIGRLVRDRRLEKGLTQDELGRLAGYGAGAGVAISRFENGQLQPAAERLERIAEALGTSWDELVGRAPANASNTEAVLNGGNTSIKDRGAGLQRELNRRAELGAALEQGFTEARDRARDDFLMRLVRVAARVDGAPPPNPTRLHVAHPTGDDVETEATYQLKFTQLGVAQALAGVGGRSARATADSATAYKTFAEAVAIGTASMGSAIPGLAGGLAAALNGFERAMGVRLPPRAGRLGGNVSTMGILAGAVMGGAALGGLLSVATKRTRRQQELAVRLDELEAELGDTQPSVEALEEFLPQATDILDYIAVHAGHSLSRWEAQLGQGRLDWQNLGDQEQQRYQDFVEIAASQLAVATMNFSEMMGYRDSELDKATVLLGELLQQARQAVTQRV